MNNGYYNQYSRGKKKSSCLIQILVLIFVVFAVTAAFIGTIYQEAKVRIERGDYAYTSTPVVQATETATPGN